MIKITYIANFISFYLVHIILWQAVFCLINTKNWWCAFCKFLFTICLPCILLTFTYDIILNNVLNYVVYLWKIIDNYINNTPIHGYTSGQNNVLKTTWTIWFTWKHPWTIMCYATNIIYIILITKNEISNPKTSNDIEVFSHVFGCKMFHLKAFSM